MAGSFSKKNAATETKRRSVLVTGAAGRIGSYFAEHAHDRYDLRLMVRGDEKNIDAIRAFGDVVVGDITDLAALKRYCAGIDTILHLAASPSPSSRWSEVLPNNIVGTYNVFSAAKEAGCRRVLFASSIHAVSGYPSDVQVKTSEPVNPGDLYGVSKCFGEALARYMAEQEGVSAIAIRIGGFTSLESIQKPWSVNMFDAVVTDRDLQQLFEKCIDDETIRFAVFHGLSNNRFKRMDISDARELVGYEPVDDATVENPRLAELRLKESVMSHSLRDGYPSGLRDDVTAISDAEDVVGKAGA